MPIFDILYLLFAHWVADFVMQEGEDAKKKSSKWFNLLRHTSEYALFMTGFIMVGYAFPNVLLLSLFFASMFLSHTAIDYVTSRLNARLLKRHKRHKFFVSIGFDQWIHYVVLFLTAYWLFY